MPSRQFEHQIYRLQRYLPSPVANLLCSLGRWFRLETAAAESGTVFGGQPCRLPQTGHSTSPTKPYQMPLQRLHQWPFRLGWIMPIRAQSLEYPSSLNFETEPLGRIREAGKRIKFGSQPFSLSFSFPDILRPWLGQARSA